MSSDEVPVSSDEWWIVLAVVCILFVLNLFIWSALITSWRSDSQKRLSKRGLRNEIRDVQWDMKEYVRKEMGDVRSELSELKEQMRKQRDERLEENRAIAARVKKLEIGAAARL